ncbi:Adrenodoxin, mitochondrial [Branchiostoma belcheri]|nr:Adrenodoxin, mitochondrial [Branchiostoma belcheri]
MASSVLFPASARFLSGFRHFSRLSRAAPASFTSLCRPHNHSLSTTARNFSQPTPRAEKAKVTVHYSMADGSTVTVQSKEGENLLDIAIENDLDIDGFGACEGHVCDCVMCECACVLQYVRLTGVFYLTCLQVCVKVRWPAPPACPGVCEGMCVSNDGRCVVSPVFYLCRCM